MATHLASRKHLESLKHTALSSERLLQHVQGAWESAALGVASHLARTNLTSCHAVLAAQWAQKVSLRPMVHPAPAQMQQLKMCNLLLCAPASNQRRWPQQLSSEQVANSCIQFTPQTACICNFYNIVNDKLVCVQQETKSGIVSRLMDAV